MKLLSISMCCLFLLVFTTAQSQNVGIGTNAPAEKLDVNGKVKTNAIILNNGGSQYDFLVKSNASGEVGFKQANGGVGVNYIICLSGSFPSAAGPMLTTPMMGEIKPFAGVFAPSGWVFCQGQLLSIQQNAALFSILGITYGGNGQTTFALPDLRGAAAIGSGIASPAGYQWTLGEKHN